MDYLNKEIEALTKRKKTPSLIKPEVSCGIFQDVETWVNSTKKERKNS